MEKGKLGPAKWISKWRGHETLKSIIMVGRQEKFLNSRRSRIA